MQRHPSLHQLLVAPPQQLGPQQPHGQMVAMPHAPPAQIPYGSIPPGIAQSQKFTGGVVQGQGVGDVFTPPTFSPPSLTGGYGGSNMNGVHPLAALAAALGIGLSGPPGLPPHPPHPPAGPGPVGKLGPVPTGTPYSGPENHSPAPPGSGYLTHGGAPTPDPGRSTGGGYLGHGGAPQAGLAAALASVGKRGVYNV